MKSPLVRGKDSAHEPGGLFRCGDFLQISSLVVFSLGSSFEIVTILQNVKDSAESFDIVANALHVKTN